MSEFTGTKMVEVNGEMVEATWVGTDELVPGRTFVVMGPDSERFWMAENKVVGVRSVEVLGDRTNTRVVWTDDDPADENVGSWGNWSRMRFLTVAPVAC